ncbi:hypothetical protein AJ80_09492 [Polytolypa hystricis UAMH7299]|uniref:Uncharacterized protein n=1 Tax=Polytolypa hystricis (strain UAMH7299) TaxID=1447883 RepID=A0A2B7WPF1_POLH7|nr:hypothetical protein AJ80_09492 [Polytolypa hystricis UAMH7299]
MFRSKSKNVPIPPRNPLRNTSTGRGATHIAFELDSALHELEPARLEARACRQDSITPLSPRNGSKHVNDEESAEVPITHLDHIIARHGGRTTSIDRLPSIIRREKTAPPSLQDELVNLKRENGRLRAELAYHQKTRQVLMEMYARIVEVYKASTTIMEKLNDAVQQSSQGLAIAERDLLHFWGISINSEGENHSGQPF